jgi:hypothetical protein
VREMAESGVGLSTHVTDHEGALFRHHIQSESRPSCGD